MKSKISIVIPCFNDEKFIEESIRSAVNQTYSNKEVIVVDDGSNAQTKTILKKLEPKIDLLITQENKGLSAARNVGIEAGSGDLILVLDADDFFHKDFCAEAEIVYGAQPDCKIVTCHALRFDEDGIINTYIPQGGGIKEFLFSNCAVGNSLFSKRDWERVTGYDEAMKDGFEDWEFFIRLLKNGGKAIVIEKSLFNYRQKKTSMRLEANKIKYDLWKYIYFKHRELYVSHFDLLVNHLINTIKMEEREKIKNLHRIDFKIGKMILKPLRYMKSWLPKR